jgi:hypothetical protein
MQTQTPEEIALENVLAKIAKLHDYINKLPRDYSRKEASLDLQNHCGGWRLSVAFKLLDGEIIPPKLIETAVDHELKHSTILK